MQKQSGQNPLQYKIKEPHWKPLIIAADQAFSHGMPAFSFLL